MSNYSKETVDIKKSSTSIDSNEKDADDSDMDSLGEYADPDPSKFNEDGSFIGQYGNKNPNRISLDLTHPPTSLATFV